MVERYELDTTSVSNSEVLNKSHLSRLPDNVERQFEGGVLTQSPPHAASRRPPVVAEKASSNVLEASRRNVIDYVDGRIHKQQKKEEEEGGKAAISVENLRRIAGSEKKQSRGGVIYPGVGGGVLLGTHNNESFERVKEWAESQKRFYGDVPGGDFDGGLQRESCDKEEEEEEEEDDAFIESGGQHERARKDNDDVIVNTTTEGTPADGEQHGKTTNISNNGMFRKTIDVEGTFKNICTPAHETTRDLLTDLQVNQTLVAEAAKILSASEQVLKFKHVPTT